jgi:lysophospholipase L1-like esterase
MSEKNQEMKRANRNYKKLFRTTLLLPVIIGADLLLGTLLIPYFGRSIPNLRNLHPFYNHGFDPDCRGIVTYGPLSPTYYINSLGLKDGHMRKVEAQSSKKRILFLGDSFIEGVGLSWDSTVCGLLEKKMDTSKTDILNGAVASYSPKLYFLKAEYLLKHEHVKINEIYCFLDFSDISDELVYQDFEPRVPSWGDNVSSSIKGFYRHHSLAHFIYTEAAISVFCNKNKVSDPYLYWISSSNSFARETNFDFDNFRGNWLGESWDKPVTHKALSLVRENILKLKMLCDEQQVKFHFVIYPDSHHVFSNDDANGYWVGKNDMKYIQIWRDFATENKIDFINLFPLFCSANANDAFMNRQDYYFAGDIHWNFGGQQKVADALYPLINK